MEGIKGSSDRRLSNEKKASSIELLRAVRVSVC